MKAFPVNIVLLMVICLTAVACGRIHPEVSGGCAPGFSAFLSADPETDNRRISHCQEGDRSTAVLSIGPYPPGTRSVDLLTAGYGNEPGVALWVVSDRQRFRLPLPRVGERWALQRLTIPIELQTRAFRIELSDQATQTFGWAGLGVPEPEPAFGARMLLAVLIGHAWLLSLIVALPSRCSIGSSRTLPALLLLGLSACAVFFAYVCTPALGNIVGTVLFAAPVLVAAARGYRHGWDANASIAPATLLALLVLWLGLYPFHWSGSDWSVPAGRWRDLPIDNWLPYVFAQMVARGEIRSPMIGDWLSSDRPPLQAGLYLLLRRFIPGENGLGYQAIGAWAQALVLVPLPYLLPSALRRIDRALMLLALGTSALLVVNTLYVWPKLIAAAYCAVFHLCLFRAAGRRSANAALAGVAAGLALLSHGGAAFAIAGSLLAFVALRREWRACLVATFVGICTNIPWMLYQRLLDPPGDRLLKWHFAGQVAPDRRSFLRAMSDAYSGLSWEQWWQHRLQNLRAIFADSANFLPELKGLLLDPTPAAAAAMIDHSYHSTTYALWFFTPALILAPVLILGFVRKRGPIFPRELTAATCFAVAVWVLTMFLPGSTIVHQGSYFSVLSLQLVLMIAATRTSLVMFRAAAAGNLLVFAALYVAHGVDPTVSTVYYLGAAALIALYATSCFAPSRQADLDSIPIGAVPAGEVDPTSTCASSAGS